MNMMKIQLLLISTQIFEIVAALPKPLDVAQATLAVLGQSSGANFNCSWGADNPAARSTLDCYVQALDYYGDTPFHSDNPQMSTRIKVHNSLKGGELVAPEANVTIHRLYGAIPWDDLTANDVKDTLYGMIKMCQRNGEISGSATVNDKHGFVVCVQGDGDDGS